jgi:hypothetical protein
LASQRGSRSKLQPESQGGKNGIDAVAVAALERLWLQSRSGDQQCVGTIIVAE